VQQRRRQSGKSINGKAANPNKKCQFFGAYEEKHSQEGITGIMEYDANICSLPTDKVIIENTQAAYKKEKDALCAGECKASMFCQEITTTLTPWDSSASSSESLRTDSLDSLYSSSSQRDSSADSSDSLASSGSENSAESSMSGSSGSYMQLWQWLLLLGSLLACCAIVAALMKPKPKPRPKPRPSPPPPVEEPLPDLEPLIVQPVTTSYVQQVPMTTSMYQMAAPITTYAAAPAYVV
jgi:hypothetical protein